MTDKIDATLFGFSAKSDIETAVTSVTKMPRIVYDYVIHLDGRKFDAKDVLETLEESCSGAAYITDEHMVRALKKLGVILHGGNQRWMTAAAKGENYDMFMKLLREKIELFDNDHKSL